MSMNPFAELQQYQLGSSLMGQPQVPTPAAQPPVPQLPMGGMPQMPAQQQPQGGVPPRDANELQQRTSGWMSALQELQANPAVAMALLQMGTALTGGKKFNTALGMGLGAMGRVGAMQEGYRQRGLAEEMAQKKMGLEERKFGLDERELAAREAVWQAQAQRYGRMGAGGGGGGGGGTPSESQVAAEVQKLVDAGWPEDIAREAVLKKLYKYGPGRYTTAGSGMSPDVYQRKSDRLKHLETLEADMTTERDPARTEEIRGLKAELFGTQNVGPSAVPAVKAGEAAGPRAGGFSRQGLAEGVRSGSIKVGDSVPLADGTKLTISPAVYAKLKAETTGGF